MCDGDIHQSLFAIGMCDLGRKGTLLWRKIKADNVLIPYFPSFFHFFSKNCKKKSGNACMKIKTIIYLQ